MLKKPLSRLWNWLVSLSESIAWARMKQVEAMMYRDCKNLYDIERLQQSLNKDKKSI
jgi:hypothetical protein